MTENVADSPSTTQEQKPCVVVSLPCAGDVNPFAAKSYFAELTSRMLEAGIQVVRLDPSINSNLCWNFNNCLCQALNMRDQGEATHFAIQHSDLAPESYWLDILWEEMQRTGAHWIAAVSPIKEPHGTTSTGVSRGNVWSPWARMTMQELYNPELPETFCIDDLGPRAAELGYYLLNNTGCMLLDLRPTWWRRTHLGEMGLSELGVYFDTRNRIVYVEGEGWKAVTEPEDWHLSRMLHDQGAKVYATRKVKVGHYGVVRFNNEGPWGDWENDQTGGRANARKKEAEAEQQRNAIAKETIECFLRAHNIPTQVEVPVEPETCAGSAAEAPVGVMQALVGDKSPAEIQSIPTRITIPTGSVSFDVYTVSYNEEEMLPAFLRHYSFARRIVIYDNESTDRTVEIAKQDPRVVVRTFRTGGKYDEAAQTEIRNNAWRESGADYVIVCDVDEFVDVMGIAGCTKGDVAFMCKGRNMVGEDNQSIESIKRYAVAGLETTEMRYDKISVFSPRIKAIDYEPGMHTAKPTCPIMGWHPIMRHYLHCGEEYTIRRYKARASRMSTNNIHHGWGFQYNMSETAIRAEHRFLLAHSVVDEELAAQV